MLQGALERHRDMKASPSNDSFRTTAEHEVDRIVREAFFPGLTTGVMVEVGAAQPDYLSVGASYRALGWTVIAIEPNPVFCAAHRALGHEVLEYAASDTEADDVPFYIADSKGAEYMGGRVSFESFSSLGMRGGYADLFEQQKNATIATTIPVKVRKLDTILAKHRPDVRSIDVLVVDVEGWELNVLRGLNLERYRPKVIVLEDFFQDPAYPAFMNERGYLKRMSLRPNDVYCLKDLVLAERPSLRR